MTFRGGPTAETASTPGALLGEGRVEGLGTSLQQMLYHALLPLLVGGESATPSATTGLLACNFRIYLLRSGVICLHCQFLHQRVMGVLAIL